MKNRLLIICGLCLWSMAVKAQLITKEFNRVPLPDALKAINSASEHYRIFFIYDELEDFTVTADVKNKTVPDAVREVVGLYPMSVKYNDSIISVECIMKEDTKLIGRVVNEEGLPVEFANITLLSPADSSYITGGVSNANGDFVIPCASQRVLVKVSFVGYKPRYVTYNKVGQVGTICLTPDAIMLGGVTVKSNMPQTMLKNDAMVTTVTGTILEKSGTAEDLLGYIPMVDTSNGGVEVLGRGSAEVYINGRKLQDNTELQQITSENIHNVEVINNPGARYSASTKAVIRIKTKRPQGEGFGFMETAELKYNRGWHGVQEQVDMNYRHGGLDISGRILGKKNTTTDYFANSIDTYLANQWHQEAHSMQRNITERGIAMLQANYVINDSNSIGMRYEFARMPRQDISGWFRSELRQDGNVIENNNSIINVIGNNYNHSINVYYNGKIGGWGVDFNADGLWNEVKGRTVSDESTSSEGEAGGNRNVSSENINKNSLLAAKLVAEHNLLGGSLCIGCEVSRNNRNNGYTDESGLTVSDKSCVKESILAGFAEYRHRIGCVNSVIGIRYEHVNSDYYRYGIKQDEQSRKYADLFPNVSFSTKIGKVYMQLSYANDIQRPAYSDLSSAVTYLNRYTYEGGNPLLRPVYTRSIILNTSYSWWLISAGFNHIKDEFANTFRPYNDNPAIAFSQVNNIGTYRRFFCSISASPVIGDIWFPKITAMIQAQDYMAETPWGATKLNNPQVTIKWNNTIKLPWKLRLETKINFATAGNYGTYYIKKNNIWSAATLRRDFLDDRLNLQIKVTDPFKINKSEGYVYSASHIFKFLGNEAQCYVTIRAVYKFNVARDKYKGKGAGNTEKNRI